MRAIFFFVAACLLSNVRCASDPEKYRGVCEGLYQAKKTCAGFRPEKDRTQIYVDACVKGEGMGLMTSCSKVNGAAKSAKDGDKLCAVAACRDGKHQARTLYKKIATVSIDQARLMVPEMFKIDVRRTRLANRR